MKILPNGIWVLEKDTHISRWVEEHNSLKCDPWLFGWLQPRIQDCKIAWDVGANIGYYVCHALQSNPVCTVVAIEPLPANLRYLLRNVKANGWDHRCEIMPVAVSSQPSVVSLFGEESCGIDILK